MNHHDQNLAYDEVLYSPIDAWTAYDRSDYRTAEKIWKHLIKESDSSDEIEEYRWALGYVLLRLGQYREARQIYFEIWQKSKDHKALHQVGRVDSEARNFDAALRAFADERAQIAQNDFFSMASNSYEIARALKESKNVEEAKKWAKDALMWVTLSADPMMWACVYRLHGEIYSLTDKKEARRCFQRAWELFKSLGDASGLREIEGVLAKL